MAIPFHLWQFIAIELPLVAISLRWSQSQFAMVLSQLWTTFGIAETVRLSEISDPREVWEVKNGKCHELRTYILIDVSLIHENIVGESRSFNLNGSHW